MVRNLSDDKKQQLIVLLDRSLKHKTEEPQTLDQLYGIWSDERVDVDEFLAELKTARTFKRETIEL